MQGDEYDTMTD